ncbi:DNA mismatch repair protein MutS [Faecalispora anaeroviscerum]|uniref:DNA mismatch repair protein MutS n=1 Tax=Faecalispora anaeroviscerum TaxID=2991836 RepID=UPI0024BBB815|nr:DNA mismatch repair protein MutS [Faecalispora anaeroviscerum]
MADLSPMMKQYFEIKEQNPDTLLFFRLGDFYEMFFDDAKLASRELELTLTGRDCGQEERAPMCGVPFHSAEGYIARLVAKGYKVAICEQMEDPALAKGLVKRAVIRVITPGTVMESSMLDESKNNFICSVFAGESAAGVCFADISTGELRATELTADSLQELESQVKNELARFSPREILINPQTLQMTGLGKFIKEKLSAALECLPQEETKGAEQLLKAQFSPERLDSAGVSAYSLTEQAIGCLLLYLRKTQRTGLERMDTIEMYSGSQFMGLDLSARRNLELLETMRGKNKRGSLLWVLDKTKTAMGKRLIRVWIERPLLNPAQILRRQNAVEELTLDGMFRDAVAEQLTGIHDLERLMTRIVYGSANARELRSLCAALSRLPALRQLLEGVSSNLLQELRDKIDPLDDVAVLVDSAIVDEPPFSIREGGMIRPGYHKELDELRTDMGSGKEIIAQLETREREKTGIPKLKVGYNRVFGYYIEISNSYREKVPDEYIRKQTLTNCERFITPDLKQLEGRILGAHEKSVQLETQLFEKVLAQAAAQLERVQVTAAAVAQLDVLTSFAAVSVANGYQRPEVNLSGKIILKESRHPVVEQLLDGAPFVPNDVELDQDENRVAIITGPNMAGKSTYMRQIALIILMAQIGCFVPAQSAQIGVVDAIFTRVGASDDMASGQSTFMVEMTEVADILKNATSRSLLILDEIGRGTSTFDGMSIARAVLEHVADKRSLGAKALFATHYHELTVLEELVSGVKNYNIAVKKRGDDITFLRRIVRGGADDSFGIEVAKLAGVPNPVVNRAKQVLRELESGRPVTPKGAGKRPREEEPAQLSLVPPKESEVLERLRQMDVNTLTPIECMNTLFELSKLAQD